jgi:cellulose synthase/poly-beta-1,6-N-acetylglucosamine synthase-like glycosyltransferase
MSILPHLLPPHLPPGLSLGLFAVAALLLLPTVPLVAELFVLSLAAASARRNRPPSSPGAALRLAVIVPAHNEEALIATCVHSILESSRQAGIQTRVNVIAHNCTDATAAQARLAGANILTLTDEIGGKGIALDHGFRHALESGADAALVIDADSIASPELIGEAAAHFAAGAQALQCRYEVANPEANDRTRLATLAFLGMNVLRPLGRTRLGLSCGIFGNGFGLSAQTIAAVPYTANSIVEDLEYHLHLIRAGIRVQFLERAQVLGEMPTGTAAASTQRARWEGGRILMRRRWAFPLFLQVLRGDARMLEPLLDLLAPPLATGASLLAAGGLAAGITLLFAPHFVLMQMLLVYVLAGVVSLLLYVVVAAFLGPEPLKTLRVLASVPGYVVWKLALTARTRLAARSNAEWVRTARNAEAAKETTPAKP